MDAFQRWTLPLAILFICACSDPPPPPKTVFDPLTQSLGKARAVQDTVNQQAQATRAAVDAQERGDTSGKDASQ
jgi:hypothetical protein